MSTFGGFVGSFPGAGSSLGALGAGSSPGVVAPALPAPFVGGKGGGALAPGVVSSGFPVAPDGPLRSPVVASTVRGGIGA